MKAFLKSTYHAKRSRLLVPKGPTLTITSNMSLQMVAVDGYQGPLFIWENLKETPIAMAAEKAHSED